MKKILTTFLMTIALLFVINTSNVLYSQIATMDIGLSYTGGWVYESTIGNKFIVNLGVNSTLTNYNSYDGYIYNHYDNLVYFIYKI